MGITVLGVILCVILALYFLTSPDKDKEEASTPAPEAVVEEDKDVPETDLLPIRMDLPERNAVTLLTIDTMSQFYNLYSFDDLPTLQTVYDLFSGLETTVPSASDVPEGPDELYIVTFYQEGNAFSPVFLYSQNGNYYAEQAKRGIWEISEETFGAVRALPFSYVWKGEELAGCAEVTRNTEAGILSTEELAERCTQPGTDLVSAIYDTEGTPLAEMYLRLSDPAAGQMSKALYSVTADGNTDAALDLTGAIHNYPVLLYFGDMQSGLILTDYHGSEEILYHTRDGGLTWEAIRLDFREILGAYRYLEAKQIVSWDAPALLIADLSLKREDDSEERIRVSIDVTTGALLSLERMDAK
ncbi:MAG: DUF5301 domain-containing protein [Lachnospiraceae bacterium]|nr:DUF5301 domain-containing protein [Lachnospiraceae bacterium]